LISLDLNYEPPFNELTEKLKEEIDFDEKITIKELIDFLTEKYGEEFAKLIWDKHQKEELSKFLSIIVNGHNFRDEKFLDKTLQDGDDLTFLYIYFGG
jgi:molybdopterin converting factor small subunit